MAIVTAQNGWHRIGIHNDLLKEKEVEEHQNLTWLNFYIYTEGHFGEGNNEVGSTIVSYVLETHYFRKMYKCQKYKTCFEKNKM